MPGETVAEMAKMKPRLLLQGCGDLNELLVGIQSEVDEDPFATTKLAGPAAASAEPLVADLIAELPRDLTTLFEQFYCVHPSLSI